MFKKSFILAFVFVALSSVVGYAAEPQVVAKSDLKTWDREDVAGGTGTLYGKFSITRHEAPEDFAIKEIGWMTLEPGSSIGMHTHDINEDAYIIVSGEGTFTETDGTKTVVRAGDVTIARMGHSHALANTGAEPLIFLDVIGQK